MILRFPLYNKQKMILNAQDDHQTERAKILPHLSRLDDLPFARWHFFMALALGLVWIFDGYEVSLISLYRNQIQQHYSEPFFKGLVTAYQVGAITGSFTFGIMGFIIGRRKLFVITLLIYLIGVLLSGIETTPFLFILARFVTGLSVGGQFTAIFSAVDQFLPPRYRGRVNISIDGTWHLGGVMASLLTMTLGQTQQWRVMFLLGGVGVVSLLLMRRNVPQSPRWLIVKGRNQQAVKIVEAISQAVQAGRWCLGEYQSGATQAQNQQAGKGCCGYIIQIISLLYSALRNHTMKFVVSFSLIFTQAVFFNLVYYQYPDILKNQYTLTQSQISLYMLPIAIMTFLSTILIGPFFDTIGRKIMLLITYGTSAILLCIVYNLQQLAIRQIFMVILFMFASPASSSANLIASQVFPTASRTIVLFVMFGVSMLGGMAGVWITSYVVAAVMMAVVALLAFWFCPSAQNKSLQQIQGM